jgi:hypothetical protein
VPALEAKALSVKIKPLAPAAPINANVKVKGMFDDLALDSDDEEELSPNVTLRKKPTKKVKELDWAMMSDDEEF